MSRQEFESLPTEQRQLNNRPRMKALTIKQPWASLIICGAKDIENRDWPTNYRGIVAIHSSAKMARADMEDACDLMGQFIPKFSARRFQQDTFPTGAILGTVEIVGCVRASESPWFVGSYGFVLKDARQFTNPIPCKGALGFWTVPDEIVQQARAAYRTARCCAKAGLEAMGNEEVPA